MCAIPEKDGERQLTGLFPVKRKKRRASAHPLCVGARAAFEKG